MNDIQRQHAKLADEFVKEILKAKTYFVAGALKKILPPELYELAKASKDHDRVVQYCKDQGYRWSELKGETLLMKANVIVGRFRPVLVGEGADKHCEFLAFVLGDQIPVSDNVVMN